MRYNYVKLAKKNIVAFDYYEALERVHYSREMSLLLKWSESSTFFLHYTDFCLHLSSEMLLLRIYFTTFFTPLILCYCAYILSTCDNQFSFKKKRISLSVEFLGKKECFFCSTEWAANSMIVKHDSFNMQTAFFEEKWNLMKMIMSTPGHRSYTSAAHMQPRPSKIWKSRKGRISNDIEQEMCLLKMHLQSIQSVSISHLLISV